MSEEILFDQMLDTNGVSCPLPILKTKTSMEGLTRGQVLKVETMGPGSKNDMASWAKRTGNTIVTCNLSLQIDRYYPKQIDNLTFVASQEGSIFINPSATAITV